MEVGALHVLKSLEKLQLDTELHGLCFESLALMPSIDYRRVPSFTIGYI